MNQSSESEDGSCSSTEVAIRGGGRRRSRVMDDSEGEGEKCLPGLENAAPQKLSSDEESEDGGAVMSGPKTRLLRRTIHDRDFDSSSNEPNAKKLIISMSPTLPSPRMHNQKSNRLLKGGSVRSGDEGDSGSSLDEFIVDEESEVEEELLGWGEEEGDNKDDTIEEEDEEDEEGVSINYMALTFQLQQDEDRRISGDSEILTFDKAFPQYLQFLCLAVDPRLDARHRGKTNGEEFMSRWPLDMHKINLKHLAAATSKVESDIRYQMKAYVQSGAWNSSFVKLIQSYPTMESKSKCCHIGGGSCSACNHHRSDIYLSVLGGSFYDGASVWNSKRWDRYLPNGWDVNGDAIKCFQDEETSETIMLGSHCHSKVCTA